MEILQRGGIDEISKIIKDMTEKVRYTFYALAMDEIGIKPAFSKEEWWIHIKKPFISLINADKEIRTIQTPYKKMFDVEIKFE